MINLENIEKYIWYNIFNIFCKCLLDIYEYEMYVLNKEGFNCEIVK